MDEEEVEGRVSQLETDVAELADRLLGSRRTNLEGGGRNNDGFVHEICELRTDVTTIKQVVTNGGVKVKWPWVDWPWGKIVSGLVAIGAAVAGLIATGTTP